MPPSGIKNVILSSKKREPSNEKREALGALSRLKYLLKA
jgi:hypothetical protein